MMKHISRIFHAHKIGAFNIQRISSLMFLLEILIFMPVVLFPLCCFLQMLVHFYYSPSAVCLHHQRSVTSEVLTVCCAGDHQ